MPRPIPRRRFLTSSSVALAAAQFGVVRGAEAEGSVKLALEGGEKAVTTKPGAWVRWGEQEHARLGKMLEQSSLFYWKGPQTAALIERFKQHYPLQHVMTCSSGTAALHIAVAAAGIRPGDEVITTAITDQGTIIGVLFQQGVPIFADLEPDTANLSVEAVARAITPRTRAIIAVHLTGNPCDLDGLRALADRHKLVLIEDCAQAWGTLYRGKPVGMFGHIACFSLQQSKHITCGDGGIVASNDTRFGPQLQLFGDKGMNRISGGFETTAVLATNYRMSEPQAAVAAAQFERLEKVVAKRARLGGMLNEALTDLPGVVPPRIGEGNRATYWFYLMMLDLARLKGTREQFVKALVAEGVPASPGYIPVPLYKLPVFQNHAFFAGQWPVKELKLTSIDYRHVKLPVTERILRDCVQIRLNESMSEPFIREVGAAVRKVARHYAEA